MSAAGTDFDLQRERVLDGYDDGSALAGLVCGLRHRFDQAPAIDQPVALADYLNELSRATPQPVEARLVDTQPVPIVELRPKRTPGPEKLVLVAATIVIALLAVGLLTSVRSGLGGFRPTDPTAAALGHAELGQETSIAVADAGMVQVVPEASGVLLLSASANPGWAITDQSDDRMLQLVFRRGQDEVVVISGTDDASVYVEVTDGRTGDVVRTDLLDDDRASGAEDDDVDGEPGGTSGTPTARVAPGGGGPSPTAGVSAGTPAVATTSSSTSPAASSSSPTPGISDEADGDGGDDVGDGDPGDDGTGRDDRDDDSGDDRGNGTGGEADGEGEDEDDSNDDGADS